MSAALACSLLLHLASMHSEPGYNTLTPGAGVVCESGHVIAAAGAYRNSIGKGSAYAVAGLEFLAIGKSTVGAVAGAVTGYGPEVRPLAALTASVPTSAGTLRLMAIPRTSVTPWTLSVGVSW